MYKSFRVVTIPPIRDRLPGRRTAGRLPPGEHQPGKMQRRYAPFLNFNHTNGSEPLNGIRRSGRRLGAPNRSEFRRKAPSDGPVRRHRDRPNGSETNRTFRQLTPNVTNNRALDYLRNYPKG